MKQDSMEKRFDKKFIDYIDHEFVISNNKPITIGIEQLKAFIKQEIKRVIGKDEEDSLSEVRGELTKDARHFILDNTNYIRNQLRASQRKKGSLG